MKSGPLLLNSSIGVVPVPSAKIQSSVPHKPVHFLEDPIPAVAVSVLVVDDNPMDTLLCQRLLERHGFQVAAANDPLQALARLEQQDFDLLLVDIHMPHMDGFDLIERACALRPNMAVLLMTGFGTVETGIQALQRGADGLILKPFQDVEALVEAANGALQQKRQKLDVARLQVLEPLFSISEKIISETDSQKLNALIVEATCTLLRGEHAVVFLNQPGAESCTRLTSTPSAQLWQQVDLVDGLVALARRQDASRILNAGSAELAAHRGTLESLRLSSFLLASVTQKNGQYIFIAARESPSVPFDEPDLETFTIFARQAAIKLKNSLLYEEQYDTLQRLKESQQALVQAEKMAVVGRLLASVAHEVNNPIQAVSNCLHLAERVDLDCQQRESYLRLGREELDRLADTVQRMLNYYRHDKTGITEVSIAAIVEVVLELLRPQLAEHQVEVAYDIDLQLPPVSGVQNQIQQVIFNLVMNALEAMKSLDGRRYLWIEAEAQADEMMIRMEDSGPGIPQGDENHIFEPFFSTKPDGTGLGLAVCCNIVEAHRGEIQLIPPQHGNGACFLVKLPIGSQDGSA